MAALSAPLRVCRGILKELRYLKGPEYKGTMMYSYVMEQFRKNQVGCGAVYSWGNGVRAVYIAADLQGEKLAQHSAADRSKVNYSTNKPD